MAKININVRYNQFLKKYDVIIDGKQTSNPELIGLFVLDAVSKIKSPNKNIHRIIDRDL